MYSAVIIDDEAKLREVLCIKLNRFCPEIKIVGQAGNAEEGFQLINELNPQLIFLDISMPVESGFDLIHKFQTIDFEIIFVTGYNEYSLDALKVSAVDYLLKPVQTEGLIRAVDKAKARIDDRTKAREYKILQHNLSHLGDQKTKIAIPGTQAYEFVEIQHIIRCEGWQKYTRIHLSNGSEIVSSYNIGVFKELLENYQFFSTHKSHLINKNHIKRYLKDGTLIMADDSNVPVSRRRKEAFMEEIVKQRFAF